MILRLLAGGLLCVGPAVGTIVVWARGRRHGHVGIITARTADGRWIVR